MQWLRIHSEYRPLQFRVTYLFQLTLVIAVATLPIAYWGVGASCLSVWLGLVGLAGLHARYAVATLLAASGLLLATLFLAINDAHPPNRRNQCFNRIRQIAVAINNYESVHGHFPPPYIADENGTPMHSWRVLFLPYIEEQALYDQYYFSKPWNHPDNLKLAANMPDVYRCPSDDSAIADVTTSYVAVVGQDTMWSPTGVRQVGDISDGLSKTLLLVESTSSRTHWMAPRDADVNLIDTEAKAGATHLLNSPHTGGSVCSFCDATVKFIPDDLSAEQLKAMSTIDGGESADPDAL